MIRRMLCLLCSVLLLAAALPAAAEDGGSSYSYDFDLSFSLNAQSFPPLLRSRASGYEALVDCLGMRGHIAWDTETQSVDISATVYFTDDESLSYPFRLFGVPERLFITSPLIKNETILLNMSALMEFAVKTKNTLGVPLPYLAFLYPYSTRHAFSGLVDAWNDSFGNPAKSGSVTAKQITAFAGLAEEQLRTNTHLRRWISALAEGSDAPDAIETLFSELPAYCQAVTGGRKVTVSAKHGTEVWKNAAGLTLFTRRESEGSLSLDMALPAEENGYYPSFSFSRQDEEDTYSFSLQASVLRDETTKPVRGELPEEEYEEDEDYYPADEWADLLFSCSVGAAGLPLSFPADASFSVDTSVKGAAYPNYTLVLLGETKSDGSFSLSLYKPFSRNADPVVIFCCTGTVLPAEPEELPDYLHYDYKGTYNVFSFNETRLAAFRSAVLPSLIRSAFSFVAATPTAACQSFLDDLTDMGLLDLLLD